MKDAKQPVRDEQLANVDKQNGNKHAKDETQAEHKQAEDENENEKGQKEGEEQEDGEQNRDDLVETMLERHATRFEERLDIFVESIRV